MADNTRHLTFEEVVDRLEAGCIPEPNSGCCLWLGSFCKRPRKAGIYGNIRLNGRMVKTHRVTYQAAYGSIPPGTQVLHRCDVPLCCNPTHLFLGDNAANIADKVAKDRAGKKLTLAQAREVHKLRASGLTHAAIARRFSVNNSNISRILAGKRRPAAMPAAGRE